MESKKKYNLIIQKKGDEIIYFEFCSMNLTLYLEALKKRLRDEKPQRFCEKEIAEAAKATGWRIRESEVSKYRFS